MSYCVKMFPADLRKKKGSSRLKLHILPFGIIIFLHYKHRTSKWNKMFYAYKDVKRLKTLRFPIVNLFTPNIHIHAHWLRMYLGRYPWDKVSKPLSEPSEVENETGRTGKLLS